MLVLVEKDIQTGSVTTVYHLDNYLFGERDRDGNLILKALDGTRIQTKVSFIDYLTAIKVLP